MPIITYGSFNGQFSSVEVSSTNSCVKVSSSSVGYNSNSATLTTLLVPVPSCMMTTGTVAASTSSGGLSTNAIVGISVGAILFGIGLMLLLGLATMQMLKKRQERAKARIKQMILENLRNVQ